MIDRRAILRTLGVAVGSTALGSVAPGCRAAPQPVESWEDRFGPAREPERSVEPRALLALEPGGRHYLRLIQDPEADDASGGSAAQGGQGSGTSGSPRKRCIIRIERAAEDERFPYRRHTPNNRIEHIGFDEDGAARISAVEDLQHDALTRYDPPLPLIPAELELGKPMTFEADLNVVQRSNPDRQKDQGSCEQTLTYEADQRVITPAGRFDCLRIRTAYKADLTLANVHQNSIGWYAPDVGLVAEQYNESVRAFIINMDKQWRIVLRKKPGS